MTDFPSHPLAPFLQPARRAIEQALQPFPEGVRDFILFGLKMAWSCLFGAVFLVLMIATHLWWPDHFSLARYDFLFIAAIVIQAIMLITGLETKEEFKVIMAYHLIGTVMEVFKTHSGSWSYPEDSLFRIGGVPLFTGFMYGTIGSFIVRALKIFDMRIANYPKSWITYVLGLVIYVNFFSHHYVIDVRNVIFIALGGLFFRAHIFFRVDKRYLSMPFLLAGTLTAGFVWIAENIGTLTRTWAYPHDKDGWQMVSIQKMGAWGLLLVVSFIVVTTVVKIIPPEEKDMSRANYSVWWQESRSFYLRLFIGLALLGFSAYAIWIYMRG